MPLRKDARPSLAERASIDAAIVDIPAFDGGKIPTNVYVPDGEQPSKHPGALSAITAGRPAPRGPVERR